MMRTLGLCANSELLAAALPPFLLYLFIIIKISKKSHNIRRHFWCYLWCHLVSEKQGKRAETGGKAKET